MHLSFAFLTLYSLLGLAFTTCIVVHVLGIFFSSSVLMVHTLSHRLVSIFLSSLLLLLLRIFAVIGYFCLFVTRARDFLSFHWGRKRGESSLWFLPVCITRKQIIESLFILFLTIALTFFACMKDLWINIAACTMRIRKQPFLPSRLFSNLPAWSVVSEWKELKRVRY